MRPQTLDEEFSQSYEKKGLQPYGLIADERSEANDNDVYAGDNDNDSYQPTNTKARGPSLRRYSNYTPAPSTSRVRTEYAQSSVSRVLSRTPQTFVIAKAASLAVKNIAKVKVGATNMGIYSWALPVWFLIQLPLALISLAFLGIASALAGAMNEGGIIGFATNTVATVASATATVVDSVFGTDLLTWGDPSTYAIATLALVFIIGIIKLMIIGLIYQPSLTNSVFGEGSALKICVLILAIFGYFTPFLNLIPWFLFWTWAVWLYPR